MKLKINEIRKMNRQKEKKTIRFNIKKTTCPQQKNTYDCGVYLCQYMFSLAKGVKNFPAPKEMETRTKIKYAILNRDLGYLDRTLPKPRVKKAKIEKEEKSDPIKIN